MMTMITLKRITPQDDLPKLIQDLQTVTWVEASEMDADGYTVADLLDFVSMETHILCVAYWEGAFAGMAFAHLLKKVHGEKWLYLDEIDVCQNHQRKGVATQLVKYFLAFGKAHGCSNLWLGTEIDNIPARGLYKSLRPSEVEEFVGYYFDLGEGK